MESIEIWLGFNVVLALSPFLYRGLLGSAAGRGKWQVALEVFFRGDLVLVAIALLSESAGEAFAHRRHPPDTVWVIVFAVASIMLLMLCCFTYDSGEKLNGRSDPDAPAVAKVSVVLFSVSFLLSLICQFWFSYIEGH
jgi:hypothetical protein